jgi:hypothetical protein
VKVALEKVTKISLEKPPNKKMRILIRNQAMTIKGALKVRCLPQMKVLEISSMIASTNNMMKNRRRSSNLSIKYKKTL